MISTNEFKTGVTIEHEGNIFQVIEFQHVKPGKGSAFVRSKLRNLRSGAVVDKTWNAGEKVKGAHIEKNKMQYLYDGGEMFVFMSNETYEQVEVPVERIEYEKNFMIEGMEVTLIQYQGEFLGVMLPEKMSLLVTVCPPAVKGNTATNATKLATVETGYSLNVPMFIAEGDRLIINTSTGEYVQRDK